MRETSDMEEGRSVGEGTIKAVDQVIGMTNIKDNIMVRVKEYGIWKGG